MTPLIPVYAWDNLAKVYRHQGSLPGHPADLQVGQPRVYAILPEPRLGAHEPVTEPVRTVPLTVILLALDGGPTLCLLVEEADRAWLPRIEGWLPRPKGEFPGRRSVDGRAA